MILRVNTTSGLVIPAARASSQQQAGKERVLEGLAFRRVAQHPRGGLYFATSHLGVIGLDVTWPDPGTVQGTDVPGVAYPVVEAAVTAVAQWPLSLNAGDLEEDKIGGLFVLHGSDYGSSADPDLLFALLDNARLIRAFNMDTGSRVGSRPTPGASTAWEGLFIRPTESASSLELWLASDTPSQLSRFAFSLKDGIASCA